MVSSHPMALLGRSPSVLGKLPPQNIAKDAKFGAVRHNIPHIGLTDPD